MKTTSTMALLLAAMISASALVLGCSGEAGSDEASTDDTSTSEALKDSVIEQFFLGAQDHDERAWPVASCRQKNPSSIKTPFTIQIFGSSGQNGLPPIFLVLGAPTSTSSDSVISDFDSVKTLAVGRGGLRQYALTFTTKGVGPFRIDVLDGNAKLTAPGGTVDLTCNAP